MCREIFSAASYARLTFTLTWCLLIQHLRGIWAKALIGEESEQEEILRQCVGCECKTEVIK